MTISTYLAFSSSATRDFFASPQRTLTYLSLQQRNGQIFRDCEVVIKPRSPVWSRGTLSVNLHSALSHDYTSPNSTTTCQNDPGCSLEWSYRGDDRNPGLASASPVYPMCGPCNPEGPVCHGQDVPARAEIKIGSRCSSGDMPEMERSRLVSSLFGALSVEPFYT